MKSQLRQLYERYQAAGFPSRLQIKLDMEALLAEEDKNKHPMIIKSLCDMCGHTGWMGRHPCDKCKGAGYVVLK